MFNIKNIRAFKQSPVERKKSHTWHGQFFDALSLVSGELAIRSSQEAAQLRSLPLQHLQLAKA